MRRASRIEARPIEFVWRKRIPAGMVTVVSGRPGEGKSTFTAQLAADVSQTAPVIFSNQEDPVAEVVRPRLEAAGAVLRRIFIPEQPFMLPRDVEALERKIKQLGAKLIVFDAALQHLESNAFNGQEIRRAITPLKAMLERTGCGCVFVDHLKKRVSGSAHPLEALAGAGSGMVAAARFVYVFGTHPKIPEERVLAPVKVNVAPAQTSASFELTSCELLLAPRGSGRLTIEVGRLLLTSDACEVDASQVIAHNGRRNGADVDVTKRAIAAEWLTGFLMLGERPAKEVENEGVGSGFSWATLRRAAEAIGVVKDRRGFGKQGGWFWRLPDGHPALAMGQRVQGGQP